MPDRADYVSAPCWDGKHERCTGWLLHSDRSSRCTCLMCNHPPVDPDRHLHEPPQRGFPWPVPEGGDDGVH